MFSPETHIFYKINERENVKCIEEIITYHMFLKVRIGYIYTQIFEHDTKSHCMHNGIRVLAVKKAVTDQKSIHDKSGLDSR